jgi:hypothetical protein
MKLKLTLSQAFFEVNFKHHPFLFSMLALSQDLLLQHNSISDLSPFNKSSLTRE